MLQQDEPDDYVITTGVQYSMRQFVEAAAQELGVRLRWEGEGVDEVGIVDAVESADSQMEVGGVIVWGDPGSFWRGAR